MSDPASGDAGNDSSAPTLAEAEAKILACESPEALKEVEREYVGKQGVVARLLASIPNAPPEERPEAGKQANILKKGVQQALEARQRGLADAQVAAEREGQGFDPSLPPPRPQRGSLHPLTQVTREL